MVSKRQKQARKRFKDEHPESFPKPEPTPPKDPSKKKKKKKKKKSLFKRKKADPKGPKTLKRSLSKHPLRVAGMRPGESCFICKAKEHIAKHCPEKAQWEKNKICLLCRRRGHGLKNCPNKSDDTMDQKLCYNCGKTGHALSACPQPLQDGGTKYATCFICNERGHLSKDCSKNTHGIYPKGGCCNFCGGVTHLAKDCPNKAGRDSNAASGKGQSYVNSRVQSRGQLTKFISGDDLDDDFMAEDAYGKKEAAKSSGDGCPVNSDLTTVKPKKPKGQRVVNFVG